MTEVETRSGPAAFVANVVVLALFLGFVFLPVLAFGDAEYRGHLNRSGGGA